MLEMTRSSAWAAAASCNKGRVVRHYVWNASPRRVPTATWVFDKLFTHQLVVGECVMLPLVRGNARDVKACTKICRPFGDAVGNDHICRDDRFDAWFGKERAALEDVIVRRAKLLGEDPELKLGTFIQMKSDTLITFSQYLFCFVC